MSKLPHLGVPLVPLVLIGLVLCLLGGIAVADHLVPFGLVPADV